MNQLDLFNSTENCTDGDLSDPSSLPDDAESSMSPLKKTKAMLQTESLSTTVPRSAPQAKSKPAASAVGSNLFRMFHELASSYAAYADIHGLPISATSGPKFGGSFETPARHALWESRLRAQTAELGSTLYELRWKSWPMTLGESIPALRASARPISVSVFIGLPTPTTCTGGAETAKRKKELGRMNAGGDNLQAAALMTGWATPSARDWKYTPGMATTGINPDGTERPRLDQLPRQAHLTGWITPSATDDRRGGRTTDGMSGNTLVQRSKAMLTGWPTPTALDRPRSPETMAKCAAFRMKNAGQKTVPIYLGEAAALAGPARLTASGAMLTGSDAQMESGGQLNPRHSLWLMLGPFGIYWLAAAERVTRSRSRSAKPEPIEIESPSSKEPETP